MVKVFSKSKLNTTQEETAEWVQRKIDEVEKQGYVIVGVSVDYSHSQTVADILFIFGSKKGCREFIIIKIFNILHQ